MTKAVPSAPAAQAGPPPDLPKCNYVSQDIRYHESLRQLQSWARDKILPRQRHPVLRPQSCLFVTALYFV